MEEYVREFLVACSFKDVEDGFGWAFAGVYGPNTDSNRSSLWDEIAGSCSWWDGPWCIGGDFNITRFSSESSGYSRIGTTMADFSDHISDLDLVDLPLVGGEFMWSNGKVWSRLDIFLVSPSWEVHFPNVCQKRLPRLCLDHFLILLDCGGLQWVQRYFKYENMWLKVDGFGDKVRLWWSSH